MTRTYCGVGARKSPPDILDLMRKAGAALARQGYVLRTGGAEGADEAFREGAVEAGGLVELYLPKPGFNFHRSARLTRPTELATQIAAEHHPRWAAMSANDRLFHGRNAHIALGADCDAPAAFALLWTPGGAAVGGTAQVIRLATAYQMPIFNLARSDHRARVERMISGEAR